MRLIDLDEYRPGPFVLDADRLPGSRSYMAPEEFVRGALIDERTTVHLLGRTLHHLLDSAQGWRGNGDQRRVVDRATESAPATRYPNVPALVRAWRLAAGGWRLAARDTLTRRRRAERALQADQREGSRWMFRHAHRAHVLRW
ncbi:hypothetical protein [Micromonospora arborensis]|uniref:hypothetical protein n=1 Tax=Micromonospora arborensis TaxID=2116518 RepID=UPI001ABF27F7|nr:hypothetical protein [Micromonospora arborensis]